MYLGSPVGPACHTGRPTCFFQEMQRVDAPPLPVPMPESSTHNQDDDLQIDVIGESYPKTTLYQLEDTISSRKASIISNASSPPTPKSWTARLLSDRSLLRSKVREEADELCRASEDGEEKERVASEMADLLYHSMVLINSENVPLEMVMETLRNRFGVSGVQEKEGRSKKKVGGEIST